MAQFQPSFLLSPGRVASSSSEMSKPSITPIVTPNGEPKTDYYGHDNQALAAEKTIWLDNPLDHFSEHKEVPSLISALPQVCQDPYAMEASQERLLVILDKYQEQPQLLDSYLEDLIIQLFKFADPKHENPPTLMHQAFKYLYYISKVRSPKVVVRWFTHEVADLVPVLRLLQQQDRNDFGTWETRYILFLWLSIIIIIPFDLSRMDTPLQSGDAPRVRTVDRIYDLAKLYLGVTDKSRDAAAMMLAKFLSRPDVMKLKLTEFLDWSSMILSSVDGTSLQGNPIVTGVLATLSSLFKHAKREDVMEYAPRVLEQLTRCRLMESVNTQLRKLNIKLTQRIGMTFMPHQVASWRYKRGLRSLHETLSTTNPSAHLAQPSQPHSDEDASYDVPEEIEDVLELLLTGLRDKDTVVRWSAAKGIGRLTGRLPKDLADEVVQSLLEFFTIRESDTAWHGGCLALAELGRRGLLLPQRLSEVVPVVLKALMYDVRRGLHSVGAHVRDAACYVCWSFARAYEPDELKPYVNAIACGLVITTVFDREVNCRKAASAAFQENVGRQGTFPHGIDILTVADYFSVANINNAYTNLSVHIAQYSEYSRPIIDHLVEEKLSHWDSSIRELAAETLRNLTARDHLYIKHNVLPPLLPLVTSPDASLRHGALRAVSELTFSLYEYGRTSGCDLKESVGEETIIKLLDVAPRLVANQVFKGAIGEIMSPAALKFIERMCGCGLMFHGPVVVETWQSIIDDNLPHTEESIRMSAVSALTSLCETYYSTDQAILKAIQGSLIPRYISHLTNEIHYTRMGFVLALGGLPRPLLHGQLSTVLDSLRACVSDIEGTDPKFAEARRDAVYSITSICKRVCVSPDGSCDQNLCADNVGVVYKVFFTGVKDYTRDGRGDIGALVREASMRGLAEILVTITDSGHTSLITPDICKEALCCIIQQANEKIDRTRGVALTTLTTLLLHTPHIPHIPHHTTLTEIFCKGDLEEVNWTNPQTTFPLTVKLLGLPDYSYHTLLGLIVSVGGLTESTVRQSSASLLSYLKSVSSDSKSLETFSIPLLAIFKDFQKDARVTLPLLKTLDLLLSNGIFDMFMEESHPFPGSLLALLKEEIKKSRDAVKLLSSISVFCGLLQFPSIRTETLNQIMILLCHHFPAVRKTTADQLYVTMVMYDDLISEDVSDEVVSILSNTSWSGEVVSVREQRNNICDLLKLPKPKLIAKKSGAPKKTKVQDDLESYRDLVDRAGY